MRRLLEGGVDKRVAFKRGNTVLETSLNVLEMLKLLTQSTFGYHSNSSKEMCFIWEIARFQPKNTNIQMATKSTDNIMKLF